MTCGSYGCWWSILSGFFACFCFFGWREIVERSEYSIFAPLFHYYGDDSYSSRNRTAVIKILIRKGIYNSTDFTNEIGIIPPYWGSRKLSRKPIETKTDEWGPCFAPHKRVNWDVQVDKYRRLKHPSYSTAITTSNSDDKYDWASFCRPGFLIIGAGKCGTSSLYHYLTEHPRVLPASEKQIHYFKYFPNRSMKWYLHHFPTATSFLSMGALVTGEASPGYLPYPDVPILIKERLPETPKIIIIGREPIDRAYSSYKYNYKTPTIDSMKKGRYKDILRKQNDTYYENFLFTFEEMIIAELQILRECLDYKNGSAVIGARKAWYNERIPIYYNEYNKRDKLNINPLIDLDGYCYGDTYSKQIPRKQWVNLMKQHPHKIIENKNIHLKQSIIGRGLYVLPLEWWYTVFNNKNDIYFVCTEELSDMSGQPMNNISQFLGLPIYNNFTNVIAKGAYNVGGHRGYDKEITWNEIYSEYNNNNATSNNNNYYYKDDIPLSSNIRHELEEFVKPYNEQLFQLVGRRCNW